MSAATAQKADYRYATMGDLGDRARKALRPAIPVLGLLLGGDALYEIFNRDPGGTALGLIAVGACFCLTLWRKFGEGLPLMPMIVLQHVIVYGLPLVINHETVVSYPPEYTTKAGIELLVFLLTLGGAWRFALRMVPYYTPMCYALQELSRGGNARLARIGFALLATTLAYQVFERNGILYTVLSLLPNGLFSVVWALVSAAGTCGVFILALLLGGGALSIGQKLLFWLLLGSNCYIEASSFLLSAAFIMVATVVIGLFWSTGRMPWIYVALMVSVFSFLNVGKVVMRQKYWGEAGADNIPEFTLGEMPDRYSEWLQASYDCMVDGDPMNPTSVFASERPVDKKQSLAERVNNMQNLLFVIDAVETHHIDLLYGKTYTIIPALLIPRFLWPDKPGTHEGQVILNVHFGRQDLESTTTTYVAWGLLPEAYGNFGPYFGSIFLGSVLGFIFAWIERYTAKKLVISVEGFVAFTIFLSMVNSFELVASVLVTSIEQSIIPIVSATIPFARRKVVPRREDTQG